MVVCVVCRGNVHRGYRLVVGMGRLSKRKGCAAGRTCNRAFSGGDACSAGATAEAGAVCPPGESGNSPSCRTGLADIGPTIMVCLGGFSQGSVALPCRVCRKWQAHGEE